MDVRLRKELDSLLKRIIDTSHNGDGYKNLLLLHTSHGTMQELMLMVDILCIDGYIELSHDRTYYKPTRLGKRFNSLEGYMYLYNKEIRKRNWQRVVIIATALHAIILIYLTWLSTKGQ